MIGILPLIIKKTRPIYNRAGQKCGNNGRAVSPRAKWSRWGASAGVLPLGTRRGAAVTGTAKERCGVTKPWPRSGQTAPGRFARRNAAPDFARQTQKVGPMTGQRGFAAGEMEPNGDKRRGFAVGDPARRSRDGTAKERCGVTKPWPRSGQTAPGRFARRNAAPDFARQTQKVGPMTGQRGFAAGEMEPNGDKRWAAARSRTSMRRMRRRRPLQPGRRFKGHTKKFAFQA